MEDTINKSEFFIIFPGFSKLYSLEYLDLSGNEISQLLEVRHLNSLPCLGNLILQRNPIAHIIDYRIKVLELFIDRAKEVRY